MKWSKKELNYIDSHKELLEEGSITEILGSLNAKYHESELNRKSVTRIFTLISYLRFLDNFTLISWSGTDEVIDLRIMLSPDHGYLVASDVDDGRILSYMSEVLELPADISSYLLEEAKKRKRK